MVSIKNDAFVVGTAAAGAATANVAAQNLAAIKTAANKVGRPVADAISKTATTLRNEKIYSDVFKATKDFAKTEINATKGFLNFLRGLKAEAIMKKANEAKAAILAKNSAFAAPEAAEYFAKHGITFPSAKPAVGGFKGAIKKGFKNFGETIGNAYDATKNSAKNIFDKVTNKGTYTEILGSIKSKAGTVKDAIKNNSFIKGTDWRTVGKYAGVAAAVALTAVVAKRIYNAVTNKD